MGTMEPEERSGSARLEETILHGEAVYDADQVSAQTGIPLDFAKRLWRALGFPERNTEIAFNDADVEALRSVALGVDVGTIDADLAVTLTRALGSTMARLADWQVATLMSRLEEFERTDPAGESSRWDAALQLVQRLNPPFELLLVYAWRRHLAAAASRIEALAANEADLQTVELSVGFADIVAYTELSNELGAIRTGELVELFESRCHDVVASADGRLIKSIGDSVLFVNSDPVRAIETAEGIISVIGRDARMPDVRVGVASGAVVMRLGDVFGAPVNLAARLTTVARRNRLIIDDATAAKLPDELFETRRLTERAVRGFGLVEPVVVRRR